MRTVDVLGERDILSPPGSGRERCGQRERGDILCACMEARESADSAQRRSSELRARREATVREAAPGVVYPVSILRVTGSVWVSPRRNIDTRFAQIDSSIQTAYKAIT